MGTWKIFCPPFKSTLTVNVEPTCWVVFAGSKLKLAGRSINGGIGVPELAGAGWGTFTEPAPEEGRDGTAVGVVTAVGVAGLTRRNSIALAVPTSMASWFIAVSTWRRTMCGIRTKTV